MSSHTYRIQIINLVQGVNNPALVDFTFLDSTPTDADKAAGICGYFDAMGSASVLAPNTTVLGITKHPSTGGPGTPVPFPVAEYAALHAANPARTQALGAFPWAPLGGTAYEPLGTSLTVSLYSALPGRKSTGRHYVPWIADDVDDGNGQVLVSALGQIANIYQAMIQGQTVGLYTGVLDLVPVVHSATAGDHAIVTPIVSRNFARLKTRTR